MTTFLRSFSVFVNVIFENQTTIKAMFETACKNGDFHMIDCFLMFEIDLDPDDFVQALYYASMFNRVSIVDRLMNDTTNRVDPAGRKNAAIVIASSFGNLAVVDRLLTDSRNRVDPSARKNAAIHWASIGNHHEVVDRLLQDPRVDSSRIYVQEPQVGCSQLFGQ
jgi:ankyrin repeat protein